MENHLPFNNDSNKNDSNGDHSSQVSQEGMLRSEKPIRVAMVSGEASGDILGAGLIRSIKSRYPNAVFEGIGGPLMIAEGFKSLHPMERLSVMGLVEVLGRLFELIGIRRSLKRYLLKNRPDVFVGIDAPDFNLGLELALRKRGIKTSHYVSPSVWAWRQKRVYKIARAVDLMLTLFPFEAKFYKTHDIAVRFVGHPLADLIPIKTNQVKARKRFGYQESDSIIAILPGSRSGEVAYIGHSFILAAQWVFEREPKVKFIIPCVNAERRAQIQALIEEHGKGLPITLVDGSSREAMAASDVILLASGTATLEAMLLKKPMVVAYRVSKITFYIMQRLLKAPFVSLPNLLANKALVPELLQDDADPARIGHSVLERLKSGKGQALVEAFEVMHLELKQDASENAANAVCALIQGELQSRTQERASQVE